MLAYLEFCTLKKKGWPITSIIIELNAPKSLYKK